MNGNQINNEQTSKSGAVATRKKSRKTLFVILGVLMLGCIVVGVLILHEAYKIGRQQNEYIHTVFAETLNLVKKVSDKNGAAVFETVTQLPFGTKVEIYNSDIIRQDGKTYISCNFYRLRHGEPDYTCDKGHYLETVTPYDLYDGFYGETLLDMFPLRETRQLPVLLRHCIVEHLDDTGNSEYCFPQDANRIGTSVVRADFNLDGEEDYAVVMQHGTTNPSNRMIIMCYNPDIPKYYVAYYDYNYGLATITLFDKGARVFIGSEELVKAPNIGIVYQNQGYEEPDYGKFAVFYDPELNQFRQYRQVPLSEMNESHYEDEGYEDEEYEHYGDIHFESGSDDDEPYGEDPDDYAVMEVGDYE